MKELTIEDIEEKARLYDEAIKKLHEIITMDNKPVTPKEIGEYLFPELKESEGEKIMNEIILYIGARDDISLDTHNKWLSWLEKQGEHAIFLSKIQVGDKVTRNEDGVLVNLSQLKRVAKPAEKDEPKFKVGDYVVGKYISGYISEVMDDCYLLGYQGFSIDKQDNYHLWTIEDAKDGDVLFTSSTASHDTFIFKSIDEKGNAKCYFAYDSEDGFREGKYHFIGRATNCKPATKGQRDLLFQKMKEAGYEWDAEKKELKTISQEYPLTFNECIKSAWSEEDEAKLKSACAFIRNTSLNGNESVVDSTIDWLKSLKDRVQPKQEWSEEDEKCLENAIMYCEWARDKAPDLHCLETSEKSIDLLKSLKQRIEWKPSDEQMDALKQAKTDACGKPYFNALASLYINLKGYR